MKHMMNLALNVISKSGFNASSRLHGVQKVPQLRFVISSCCPHQSGCARSFFSSKEESTKNPPSSSSSPGSGSNTVKRHHERRQVRVPIDLLYEVVSDVDRYKEFVPWCTDSIVTERSSSSTNGEQEQHLKADLVIGFKYLTERYTSHVTCKKPSSVIAYSNQTNIFDILKTEWKFTPVGSDPKRMTWLQFQVEFKFKSMLYNELSDLFMQEVATKMVQAFENRCKQLIEQRKNNNR